MGNKEVNRSKKAALKSGDVERGAAVVAASVVSMENIIAKEQEEKLAAMVEQLCLPQIHLQIYSFKTLYRPDFLPQLLRRSR